MIESRKLFTIGHSTLTLERFIDLLQANEVTAIVDVRSQPYSRMFPHFSQQPLRDALRDARIHYVFLGREFGARRDEPECYQDGQAKYERIATTDAFKAGIDRLMDGSAKYRIALMCAEKDPLTCHRSILVCRNLRGMGFDICHIHSNGSIETHEQAERRLMVEERLNPGQMGLFGSEAEDEEAKLEHAYDLRGEKIAYRVEEAPNQ